MVSAAGDFVYAKFSEINVIIRPSCYFFSSSVMILLAFLSCLLVLKCSVCVFNSLRDCDRV